jgi:hypothetical protein
MITIIKKKSIKWWVGVISFTLLFGFIFSYSYIKMRMIVRGVEINATLEKEKSSSLVKIKGVAKNAIFLTLNGREIFIDKDGSFNEVAVLPPGLSVVTLSAKDKFGNQQEKSFREIYKENNQVAINNNTTQITN